MDVGSGGPGIDLDDHIVSARGIVTQDQIDAHIAQHGLLTK